MIADAGKHRSDDLQGGFLRAHIRIRRDGIFRVQMEPVQVGQYTQDLLARILFQPCQSRPQQFDIAAELVDDKPGNPFLFRLAEQGKRADQVSEHATLVDISDQDDRAIGLFGKTHVGDIPVPQVDLRRTACAFHNDILVTVLQTPIGFHNRVQQCGFSFMVCCRIQG